MSGVLYLLDTYEALTGASAMAATSLLRYTLAAAFPLFIDQSVSPSFDHDLGETKLSAVYRRLGIGWATSLLGFISVALMPIPWALFRWGPRLRATSVYNTNKG